MSLYRESPADELATLARRLRSRAPVEPNEDWAVPKLVDAVQRVACDETLVAPLVVSTGLSAPMIRWALRTTADGITLPILARLRTHVGLGEPAHALDGIERTNRARLATVVLAGNVFTACLRPMVLSLLYEVPVLVRTSSRDVVLAQAFAEALPPPFDEACAVVSFARDDDARWEGLFRCADSAHVYGGDDTLRSIRARLPIVTRFVGHGHGLGAAVVRGSTFDDVAARALSLDVSAYDQRGCLSPQEVLVVGTHDEAGVVVQRLVHALEVRAKELPRGLVPTEVAAAARRWRDVALATGELHEGSEHAVAFDPSGLLPLGPGHRHVVVRGFARETDVRAHLASYAAHLKSVGLCGSLAWSDVVPAGAAPRVSALGTMQTPTIDAPLDGLPPSEGFLAYVGTR
jgi:hypothetical protein